MAFYMDEARTADFWAKVKAADAGVAQMVNDALAKCAKIATGSYTGNGAYGSAAPNILTADFDIKLAVIIGDFSNTASAIGFMGEGAYGYVLHNINTGSVYTTGGSQIYVTNSGKEVSWYCTYKANSQLNVSGKVYRYVLFG